MTDTLPVKKDEEKDWKEMFDNEFGDFEYRFAATSSRIPINTNEGVADLGTMIGLELKAKVKSFISRLLLREHKLLNKKMARVAKESFEAGVRQGKDELIKSGGWTVLDTALDERKGNV